jgi:hypothetical protein
MVEGGKRWEGVCGAGRSPGQGKLKQRLVYKEEERKVMAVD